jgi:hypothetical protein
LASQAAFDTPFGGLRRAQSGTTTQQEATNMRLRGIVGIGVVLALALTAASALGAGGNTTTCTSSLASGTYGRVVVPAGATCDSESGPITIHGGVEVEPGATFVLGNEDLGAKMFTITGGVSATNAAGVQIHFATVSGGIDLEGGSGPFSPGLNFSTIEDNTINGAVTINGYNGFWQGFFRNTVNGDVNYSNNTLVDPDGNEIQTNTIHGNLNCSNNSPKPQQGDSEGNSNEVTGTETGQCVGL